jgi:hypothetical protein
VFSAGKTCNSTAEANNALLKVAYNIKADSVVKLLHSTHQRSIDDQGKSLIEMDNSAYEVSIAKGLILSRVFLFHISLFHKYLYLYVQSSVLP